MHPPLLHLVSPGAWRDALTAGAVHPSVAPFVHLSAADQVALPAERLYRGRSDLSLLLLDPDRIDVDVRWEPGVPDDPAAMRFPHAYGPVPTSAVLAVVPYRPGADGAFAPPVLPATDAAGRMVGFEASILRRAASTESPVTGGVAVRTAGAPRSHHHNMLLIDGPCDVATVQADAARALTGLRRWCATLFGDAHSATAAALSARGWEVDELVHLAARTPANPAASRVEQLDRATLRPLWDAAWRHDIPGVDDEVVEQLSERYAAEEPVVDLRYLGVRERGTVVAGALLKIDGATASLDAVGTDTAHRGRGHGDALVAGAFAIAATAGCDLIGLEADAADWPLDWYRRRGFTDVGRSWCASRPAD